VYVDASRGRSLPLSASIAGTADASADHMHFMTTLDQPSCELEGSGTSVHFRSAEMLVDVNDPHDAPS
jgi:hypothetical protein